MTDARDNMIAQLNAAAVADSGGRQWVRRADAIRILGVSNACGQYWTRRRLVIPRRIIAPRAYKRDAADPRRFARGSNPRGFVTVWPLYQAIERARRLRVARPWTPAEDDYLAEHVGEMDYQTIADQLGRTRGSVAKHAQEMGFGMRSNTGLLTTGEVARLVGRSPEAVNHWCARGLPHERAGGYHRYRLIEPVHLLRWLRTRPRIWHALHPKARQRLERLVEPRQPRQARPARRAA